MVHHVLHGPGLVICVCGHGVKQQNCIFTITIYSTSVNITFYLSVDGLSTVSAFSFDCMSSFHFPRLGLCL